MGSNPSAGFRCVCLIRALWMNTTKKTPLIFQLIKNLQTYYSIKKLLAGLWRLVQWAAMPVQISMQVLNTGELNEQQK